MQYTGVVAISVNNVTFSKARWRLPVRLQCTFMKRAKLNLHCMHSCLLLVYPVYTSCAHIISRLYTSLHAYFMSLSTSHVLMLSAECTPHDVPIHNSCAHVTNGVNAS